MPMIRAPMRSATAGATGLVAGLIGASNYPWVPLAGIGVGGILQAYHPGGFGDSAVVDGIVDASAALLGRWVTMPRGAVAAAFRPLAMGYIPIPKRVV